MDIAALSVIGRQVNLMQQVGTAVLKKTMDTAEMNSDAMVKMMEQSVNPNLGRNVDIRV